jgi:hypothetical protein
MDQGATITKSLCAGQQRVPLSSTKPLSHHITDIPSFMGNLILYPYRLVSLEI